MPTPNRRLDWSHPIAYAVADSNYSTLHYPDGRTYVTAYTLQVVAERMGLFRIHNKYAVNPRYIKSWSRVNSRSITVRVGKTDLPVARQRIPEVTEELYRKGK